MKIIKKENDNNYGVVFEYSPLHRFNDARLALYALDRYFQHILEKTHRREREEVMHDLFEHSMHIVSGSISLQLSVFDDNYKSKDKLELSEEVEVASVDMTGSQLEVIGQSIKYYSSPEITSNDIISPMPSSAVFRIAEQQIGQMIVGQICEHVPVVTKESNKPPFGIH